jgi:tetratricopeptide (TPR) repeat protein
MSARQSLLPETTRSALAAGDLEAAGEQLLGHGESLARSRPGFAVRWVGELTGELSTAHPLSPYAAWTAGAVHHLTGDTATARSLLERAARSFTARRRPHTADRVRLLLVDVYGELLDLTRARRLARSIEQRFRRRGDIERAAAAVANLGCAEDAADRVVEARRLWLRALQRLPDGGLRHLLVQANLANCATTLARFDEAAEGHRTIMAKASERGLEALARQARLNLAETEFATGHADDAFARWLEVIGQARSSGDTLIELVATVELAQAEMSLGLVDAASGRLRGAVARLESLGLLLELARALRLLALCELTTPEPAAGMLARAREVLAGPGLELQRELHELDLALVGVDRDPDRLLRAARLLEANGLLHRSALALACAARSWLRRGDAPAAAATARRALASTARSPWPRMVAHHVCARALGPTTRAGARHLYEAVRAADRVHGNLSTTSDRCSFMRLHGEVYLDQIRRLVERGRPRDRARALDLVHRLKSAWLLDQLTRRCDRGSDPLVQRWQELRRRVAALLESCHGEDEPRVRHAAVAVGRELRRLEQDLRAVETDLVRSRPLLARTLRVTDPLHDLLGTLPAGHLLVEYLVAGSDLLVFVVSDHGIETFIRRGVVPELSRLVASVQFHMDAHPWAGPRHAAERQHTLSDRLARLGDILLADVASREWTTLWLAPHDGLYHLPWAALPDGHGVALVDRGPFTLVPGAASAGQLLLDQNPAPRRIGLAGAPGPGLPMIEREIAALARTVPDPLVLERVTRQRLLDLLAAADAVHLAGHAAFMDGAPSTSGLSLGDGFLTVHDLAAAPISATLVTFGVCAGARLASAEDDRYEGFLRALLGAGVRTVIGPATNVPDATASRFAVTFYEDLVRTADPGAAMRSATLALRDGDEHPAAWACYHMYGDPRPWSTR